MHRIHGGFTTAIPIKENEIQNSNPEQVLSQSLSSLLTFLNDKRNAGVTNFDQSATTLFVSGVVLPKQRYKNAMLPPTFVLATTYCGPLKEHLYELIDTNRNILCKTLMFCEGFKGGYNASAKYIYRFLRKHSHNANFNSRCNYISKQDTKNEKELRKEIEGYIDKAQRLGAFKNCSATEVKTLIQRHIKNCGEQYAWAFNPFKKNIRERLETARVKVTNIILYLLIAVIIAPLLVVPAVIWWFKWEPVPLVFTLVPLVSIIALVFNFQSIHTNTATRPHDSRLQELAATQLNPVLNEMTAAAPLKNGFLRGHLYAFTLRLLGLVGPLRLKIPTVSNIRWVVIDKKRRLLFLSCFSNTADSYVRDFLVKDTSGGVNFLFSHGKGFPDALFTYWRGIRRDPEGYMNAVHTGQQITEFWYAHEKNLTADIINKNRKIRNGLFKKMNEEEAREWLKLL
ncbi:MAG TPA: hypothetical protein VF008_03455 [Niastella sp.]